MRNNTKRVYSHAYALKAYAWQPKYLLIFDWAPLSADVTDSDQNGERGFRSWNEYRFHRRKTIEKGNDPLFWYRRTTHENGILLSQLSRDTCFGVMVYRGGYIQVRKAEQKTIKTFRVVFCQLMARDFYLFCGIVADRLFLLILLLFCFLWLCYSALCVWY